MAIGELAMQFSWQMALFPLYYAIRIMIVMFLFANLLFRAWKCEAINFRRSQSAHVHTMPISIFWHVTYT